MSCGEQHHKDNEMKILSGKEVSSRIYKSLENDIEFLKIIKNIPKLVVILIGDRIDSLLYVKMKKKKLLELGLECELIFFPEDTQDELVIKHISMFNSDKKIHGILVQLPLPNHMDTNSILNTIDYKKDVDGFHFKNYGLLTINNFQESFVPCTAQAVMEFFNFYNISLLGKNVVIVGASKVIGLPVSLLCLHQNATVTICHKFTENIKEKTKMADILIVCCGVKHLINKSHIKKGCIIIDVGIHKENKKILGDVNQESIKNIAHSCSSVPGGVGPVTISVLIKHLIKATLLQTKDIHQ